MTDTITPRIGRPPKAERYDRVSVSLPAEEAAQLYELRFQIRDASVSATFRRALRLLRQRVDDVGVEEVAKEII